MHFVAKGSIVIVAKAKLFANRVTCNRGCIVIILA